jgi:hypothetical protein
VLVLVIIDVADGKCKISWQKKYKRYVNLSTILCKIGHNLSYSQACQN